jgi:hypothetical protein
MRSPTKSLRIPLKLDCHPSKQLSWIHGNQLLPGEALIAQLIDLVRFELLLKLTDARDFIVR